MAESSTITREGALMTKVPDDHPLMMAWKAYTATGDYENTKGWCVGPYAEGALWAAFERGFMAASVMPHPNPPGGPVANPEGERIYSAMVARSLAEIPEEERGASSMEDAVRFIERWMPESLPASDTGQVSFGRALLEMAVDSLKAAITQQRPDPRVDTQVWGAARLLDEKQAGQPEWVWFAKETDGGLPVATYSYGRWPRGAEQAPYVRADIALGMSVAATPKLDAVAVPAAGSEERLFWLEAAEQHGFEQTSGEEELPAFDPPAYLATEDEVLKLMAVAREQGRKDVLDALATGGARG